MTDQNIHTEQTMYRVRATTPFEQTALRKIVPITLVVHTGTVRLVDHLTPVQALELASALCAEAVVARRRGWLVLVGHLPDRDREREDHHEQDDDE